MKLNYWLITFLLLSLLFLPRINAASFEPHCDCEGRPNLEQTTPCSRGKEVLQLQESLEKLGYYRGVIDGIYGRDMAKAVAQLQADFGLPVTGNMDATAWAYLAWMEEKPALGQSMAPPRGDISILVDTDALILIVYADKEPYKIYPVAIGKWSTPTPLGEWVIRDMTSVWKGPFGARWMGLSCPFGGYGIHGTDDPSSIGWETSGGCVRMYNHDVIELYDWVAPGTPVTIIGTREHPFFYNLRPGDVGQSVVYLQWRLRELGQQVGRADGVYGEVTEGAIRELQHFYRLAVDGVADPNLLYILGFGGRE